MTLKAYIFLAIAVLFVLAFYLRAKPPPRGAGSTQQSPTSQAKENCEFKCVAAWSKCAAGCGVDAKSCSATCDRNKEKCMPACR